MLIRPHAIQVPFLTASYVNYHDWEDGDGGFMEVGKSFKEIWGVAEKTELRPLERQKSMLTKAKTSMRHSLATSSSAGYSSPRFDALGASLLLGTSLTQDRPPAVKSKGTMDTLDKVLECVDGTSGSVSPAGSEFISFGEDQPSFHVEQAQLAPAPALRDARPRVPRLQLGAIRESGHHPGGLPDAGGSVSDHAAQQAVHLGSQAQAVVHATSPGPAFVFPLASGPCEDNALCPEDAVERLRHL